MKFQNKTVYLGGDLSYKKIIEDFLDGSGYTFTTDFKHAEIIYWIYGKGPFLLENLRFWLFDKRTFILHWIGTDVKTHIEKIESPKLLSKIFHRFWNLLIRHKSHVGSMINLCCAPWLVEELKIAGFQAFYVPLTTLINQTIDSKKELYRPFDFMSYIPMKNFDYYSGSLIFSIARELNSQKFLIIMPDIDSLSELPNELHIPENITISPRISSIEMNNIYLQCKCFLRFTIHDGLSLSVLEAMSNRLQIFWTYQFPNTIHINLNEVEKIINKMKQVLNNWEPNLVGEKYVVEEYNISKAKLKFIDSVGKNLS